ncbi:hypothetical protein ACFLSE_03940 [Bacteroidota bacterium]
MNPLYFIKQLFILVLLFGHIACKTNKNSTSTNENTVKQTNTQSKKLPFEQIAHKKFGSDTLNYYSPKRSYILCIKESEKPQFPDQTIEYFVFDLKMQNVVLDARGSNMKISWYSDNELLFRIYPGITQTPEDAAMNVYTYNLSTKEKCYIKKNKSNQ